MATLRILAGKEPIAVQIPRLSADLGTRRVTLFTACGIDYTITAHSAAAHADTPETDIARTTRIAVVADAAFVLRDHITSGAEFIAETNATDRR